MVVSGGGVVLRVFSVPSETQSPNVSDNLHFGGGGTLDATFLKYLSVCTLEILNEKILSA